MPPLRQLRTLPALCDYLKQKKRSLNPADLRLLDLVKLCYFLLGFTAKDQNTMQARFKFNNESKIFDSEIAHYKTALYRLLNPDYDAKRSFYVDPRTEPSGFTPVWNALFNLSSRLVDLDPGLLDPAELTQFSEEFLADRETSSLTFQQHCDACLIIFPEQSKEQATPLLNALKALHSLLSARIIEVIREGAENTAAMSGAGMTSMFADHGLFSGPTLTNSRDTHIHNPTLHINLYRS